MVQITFNGQHFIANVHYEDRHIVKKAGFRWDNDFREWYTPLHNIAAKLRGFADASAIKELDRVTLTRTPWLGRIPYPIKHTPYPWQIEAARFALERNRSYLGMDPRLGKTPTAQMIINAEATNAVYICPPFLVETTREKLRDWSLFGLIVGKFEFPASQAMPNVLIVPDSMIHKPTTIEAIRVFVKSSKWNNRKVRLFADEAHRFKAMTAKRTKALFNLIVPLFEKITFLSGSPMPNRPMELFPVLSNCAPETIDYMDKFEFGQRYCAGFRNNFGWDFSGASNVPELASKVIGSFMLRLRKADVIKDLPPTLEEMVLIDDTLPPTAARLNKELLAQFSPEDLMGHLAPNGHIATYRKELGKAKIEHAVKFITELLEDEPEENLLVFAHHKEVITGLSDGLKDKTQLTIITGDTPTPTRNGLVKMFQTCPERRVLIGNIQAAGIGFDMWKASRVLFVEWSWVPGENDQAIERAWKVDKKENIFVQYLVYKNSVDRMVLETIFKKKKAQEHV